MVIQFYVKFGSRYGQSLWIRVTEAGDPENVQEFPLSYLDADHWKGSIDIAAAGIDPKGKLTYSYLLRDAMDNREKAFCINNTINLKKLAVHTIEVHDECSDGQLYEEVFQTKAFQLLPANKKQRSDKHAASPTHIFIAQTPQLAKGKLLCLTGSSKKMNKWDDAKPVLLQRKKNNYTIKLNLSSEQFPVEYKFGIYDEQLKKIVQYEEGPNRILEQPAEKDTATILNHFVEPGKYAWKGAGVNIPVSALKTTQSWGIGDFTDLHLLIDWAKATGLKLIQLLPLNDTTATFTDKDSYPYAAISAFAIHPVYLDVQKLANAFGVQFSDETLNQVIALSERPAVDFAAVVKLKQNAIKELFKKEKLSFKDDPDWFSFFDLNRHWLEPYAAFCYLRDEYNTANFSLWEDYSIFNEADIEELVSVSTAHYDDIAIHYFTQYHLHLQLKDAADYAHKKGIILKGDLPIGVGRYSVDTWTMPQIFHMDMQAGAPPDAFSTRGQNWNFPTYNWDEMAHDDYIWWRQRMEHMGNYFDTVRIDHVLGFCRIWSIPLHAVEGIFGRFVPAIPLTKKDFEDNGIRFDEGRLCRPYISEGILERSFGSKTAWVKETFLFADVFKPAYDTQQKIEAYFTTYKENKELKQGLFDLLSNVILLKDEHAQYHFRINIFETSSYNELSHEYKGLFHRMYNDYFYKKQEELWHYEGHKKLVALKNCTDMLLCAEDLGMVPEMLEAMLDELQVLSLQVERMPKKQGEQFLLPSSAPYLSVVTPSTHDMSGVREWWQEDRATTNALFHQLTGQQGEAPFYCEPWISRAIIEQHLQSPAMWAVFLLQDMLAMNASMRRENPAEERINNPADPNHIWNYRMHLTLEDLLAQREFTAELKGLIQAGNR